MEKPMLTKEEIESAKKNTNHPVVKVFLNMQDEISRFNSGYSKIEGNTESQEYVCENIRPFAEKLNTLEDFTLEPLDLVSIWSRVTQDFKGGYITYNLARTIPATYASRGIESPEWKEVVFSASEECGLPEKTLTDKENQIYFWTRIKNVKESLSELDYYSYGTKENRSELLNKAYREDNKEAKKKVEEIIAWQEKHQDETLGRIHENFSNGFSIFIDRNIPGYIEKLWDEIDSRK